MIYILIALAVFILDSNMKNYIEHNIRIGEKKDILKGKITVKREYNSGFCLNVLDHRIEIVRKVSGIAFAIVTIAFILILPSKRKRMYKLGLALCIGGGASNLKDRFKRGKVVDYFSFNIESIKHIVFNLADIFIIVGSFLMLVSDVFHRKSISKKGQILKDE